MALLGYVARSLARCALLLLGVSFAVFLLVSIAPIDPLRSNYGQAALLSMAPEKIQQLQAYWGSELPLWERYGHWLVGLLQGDLGQSLRYNAPVAEVLAERLGNSLLLMALAWAASGVIGFAMGVIAGAFRGRLLDRIVQAYCFVLSCTPTFWIAIILLLVFAVRLHWFPIGFSAPIGVAASEVTLGQALTHMALPALTLSLVGVAQVALHTREKMIDIFKSDYCRAAKAAGETRGEFLWHHGLRNGLLPAISLQFAQVAEIVSGSVLVETVFSYPGIGQAAVTAGLAGDVELLAAVALLCAALVFAGNFIADLLYGIIDPRIGKPWQKRQALPTFSQEIDGA